MSINLENFAYDQAPLTWEEFYGHPEAVAVAESFLLHRPIQSIFIDGPSGTGKTAFVRLLIMSARCTGRAEGEINPCGKCEACRSGEIRLGDPSLTDTYWIQAGGNTELSLHAAVQQALEAAEKGHRFTGRGNDDLLFVVCDEFQRFNTDQRQKMLHNAEVRNDRTNVVYIFITMQAETLPEAERMAFKRRGVYLEFLPQTNTMIEEYLTTRFECPPAVAKLIASVSEESIGMSVMYYGKVLMQVPNFDVDIVATMLHLANNRQRWELWQLIQAGNIKDIMSKIDKLGRLVSAQKLARQLLDDLYEAASAKGGYTEDRKFAIIQLQQLLNIGRLKLVDVLVTLGKLNLVSKEHINKTNDHSLNCGVRDDGT